MGFSPAASSLLGSFAKATDKRKQSRRDRLWAEAEAAAGRYYGLSVAPNRAVKEYAYAMGYYHAKKP